MPPQTGRKGSLAGYDARATARWAAETRKRPGRTAFERDRARVLHSSALRRLAAKTQVVDVDAGDFPRTRLTHSLECAQIGRELGKALGADPDLVETACLAHDLGHPPFGHNGETALDHVARACGGFEGNAQSLRLLTRLEAKVVTAAGHSAGLNLTRAALDAALKYPWLAPGAQAASAGTTKYGAYADDADVFCWIRAGAPPRRPCLEAQIMDWADDVAYSVHDLEDGLHAGHIGLRQLQDESERLALAQLTAAAYADPGEPACVAELAEVLAELLALNCWPRGFDGGPQSLAALKNLTSELIGRFCRAAEHATRQAHGAGVLSRYQADLIVPRRQRLECALLKGVTAHYVMSRPGADPIRARQRALIAGLADAVARGAPATLDPALRPAWAAAASDPLRLRVVVDQIASLTDTSAVSWHRRLCGAPLGG
ncbi:MAG TPA: deoxyguanosinetriphosphate triphosphohydrolase [Streptosporangiaceae bacterium]|nr:deoxyguanosinetriphosphate triphosphohydrolase [Streptosporangiaceae bacterium]